MPIIKNLNIEDYNLLNIKHSKDRPYFFGLGIPSRFNCNHGFQKKVKSRVQNDAPNDEHETRNSKSLEHVTFKPSKKHNSGIHGNTKLLKSSSHMPQGK